MAAALHSVISNDQAADKAEVLRSCLDRVQELATEVDVAYATARRQPGLFGQTPTQRTRLQVYVRDHFKCVYCGQVYDLTVDHVIPVSKGGLSDPMNLVTACAPCNRAKADTMPSRHPIASASVFGL